MSKDGVTSEHHAGEVASVSILLLWLSGPPSALWTTKRPGVEARVLVRLVVSSAKLSSQSLELPDPPPQGPSK